MRYVFQRRIECVLVRRDEVEVGKRSPEEVEAARALWEKDLGRAFAVRVEHPLGSLIGTVITSPEGEVVFVEETKH